MTWSYHCHSLDAISRRQSGWRIEGACAGAYHGAGATGVLYRLIDILTESSIEHLSEQARAATSRATEPICPGTERLREGLIPADLAGGAALDAIETHGCSWMLGLPFI